MNRFRPLLTYLWIGLLAIAFIFFNPAIVHADDYPDLYPKAELIGSTPKAQIDVYGSPGTQQPPIGRAAVGDQVRVIEQATDNNGNRWDRVQLINATQLEGWIAEESVSLQKATPKATPSSPYFQINQFSQGYGLPQSRGNLMTQYPPQEQIQGNGVNQYSPQQQIRGNAVNQYSPQEQIRGNKVNQYSPQEQIRGNGVNQYSPQQQIRGNGVNQ